MLLIPDDEVGLTGGGLTGLTGPTGLPELFVGFTGAGEMNENQLLKSD